MSTKSDKKFVLFLKSFIFFLIFTLSSTAFAEYYVAYPVYVTPAVTPCCTAPVVRVAHHHKYNCHQHRVKHHKSRYVVSHYVIPTCCGTAALVPTCGGCGGYYYPDFYIPPEYIMTSDDMNWDMRTSDDVYSDLDH